jgi:hypothetical protein
MLAHIPTEPLPCFVRLLINTRHFLLDEDDDWKFSPLYADAMMQDNQTFSPPDEVAATLVAPRLSYV